MAGISPQKFRVNLTKYVKMGDGKWRFCPVVTSNGRIKPDYVHVNGKTERHLEGYYSIDYYEDGKRFRRSVGTDAAEAKLACDRQAAYLQAKALGVALADDVPEAGRTPLQGAIDTYLKNLASLGKDSKTIAAYRTAILQFQQSCTKRFVDQIEKQDLIDFTGWLRKQPQKNRRGGDPNRTYFNKVSHVVIFLKAFGRERLLKKIEYPSFAERTVRYLTNEQVKLLLSACESDEERFTVLFFLKTGFRDGEAAHAEYADVHDGKIHVRMKPQYSWHPKKWQTRTVPIPDDTVASIQKRKTERGGKLIFANKKGNPDQHLLRVVQTVAKRAGLELDLHTLRRTFGTIYSKILPLQDVQKLLGHKDIQTTMRYLGITELDSDEVRNAVARAFNEF